MNRSYVFKCSVAALTVAGAVAVGCSDAGPEAASRSGVAEPRLDTPAARPPGARVPRIPSVLLAPLAAGRDAPATTPSPGTSSAIAGASVDARVLVLSADGSEPDLPAIQSTLEHMGTPHDIVIASASHLPPLTVTETRGRYQAVLLATGQLAYESAPGEWSSALTAAEWQTLADYERGFGVRHVSWYTYPTPDFGFGSTPTATAEQVGGSFTEDGRRIFSYANTTRPTEIKNAYTYLAFAAGAPENGGTARPLLTDSEGHALAIARTWADGREAIALTFDSNPYLVHHLQLAHGLVSWATRGVFLGERHVYVSPQVDDLFLDTDQWPATDANPTGQSYRMTGDDLVATVQWQEGARTHALLRAFRYSMAFNGYGSTSGAYSPDTLTPVAVSTDANFFWINHTWDHENLDAMAYAPALAEIRQNNRQAKNLSLANYDVKNLVTPDVSGLFNPEAMRAAADAGVRFLVSDTSRPGQDNPSPNAGMPNALQPAIFQIPRRPTNLYYNVTTPGEWAEMYNAFYAPGCTLCGTNGPVWDHALSYEEVLDKESEMLLQYLLRGEADPWMFHQGNLRAYDGRRSLLGDLVDRTVAKYAAVLAVPIQSPTMDVLGSWMKRGTAFRQAVRSGSVSATIVPGSSITLRAGAQGAVVPVTGLRNGSSELYAGQYITHVTLSPGQTVTHALK
jgi:hypothetical protein